MNNVITVQDEEDKAKIASRAQEIYRAIIGLYDDETERLFHACTLSARNEWQCQKMMEEKDEERTV